MAEKQKIVLASGNEHKIREIAQMLPDFEVIGYKQLGFDQEIIEDLSFQNIKKHRPLMRKQYKNKRLL